MNQTGNRQANLLPGIGDVLDATADNPTIDIPVAVATGSHPLDPAPAPCLDASPE